MKSKSPWEPSKAGIKPTEQVSAAASLSSIEDVTHANGISLKEIGYS